LVDGNGYILATTDIVGGNHNDAYQLTETLKKLFADLRRTGLSYTGAVFNADSSFDTRAARKLLWNAGVIPNIDENKRGRKTTKRGRNRHFNRDVYKRRFAIERTFAWIDKFRTLLIRFERKGSYFLGFHYLAFALINLRNLLAIV
jgi:transposase